MNILVIGGGGREHAVVKALKKSRRCSRIWCLPGNGGIAEDAECFPVKATDLDGIAAFASTHPVDFAVVTPDDPLIMGCVDRLEIMGIPCFGPDKKAAIIEGSKIFSKELMKKYGIPTAASAQFADPMSAIAYLKTCSYPAVIKADGPALGKGAVIVENFEEGERTVSDMMVDRVFGDSGERILIEQFLTGPEVSVLAFTDGKTVVPMVSSMDHKRALDGDRGLNTGGMGTIAPNPFYTEEVAVRCMREIFLPTVEAMKREGRTFKGCLYFGLMLTADGPKVIEYNCRFGDPETQVVLPLLESDLFEIMLAVRNGTLTSDMVRFSSMNACCVIVASKGYPKEYETDFPVTLPEERDMLFFAGVKEMRGQKGQLVTSGGRVVGAVGVAPTPEEAVKKAYALAGQVHFENAYMRRDIGARALSAPKAE